MTSPYKSRIESFFEVSRKITEGSRLYNEFEDHEKAIYRLFVASLTSIFATMDGTQTYLTDVDKIILDLEKLYQSSILEDDIQNVVELARVFVKGGYKYWPGVKVPVEVVKHFTNFFRGLQLEKQKIVLNHIWKRLDTIRREIKNDDLPF